VRAQQRSTQRRGRPKVILGRLVGFEPYGRAKFLVLSDLASLQNSINQGKEGLRLQICYKATAVLFDVLVDLRAPPEPLSVHTLLLENGAGDRMVEL
jgi:hypothetical protein